MYIPDQSVIINHYGIKNQFNIHMEECAELIQAISKCNRSWNTPSMDICKNHLVEEIADVLICIEQLKVILNLSDEDIQNMINYKYDRQKERIEYDSK